MQSASLRNGSDASHLYRMHLLGISNRLRAAQTGFEAGRRDGGQQVLSSQNRDVVGSLAIGTDD
jgi:hypothetical protein